MYETKMVLKKHNNDVQILSYSPQFMLHLYHCIFFFFTRLKTKRNRKKGNKKETTSS